MARRRGFGAAGLILCACTSVAAAQEAAPTAASTTADSAPGETSFLVENLTRAEAWGFFEPPPDGGDEPDYFFAGNRSTLGIGYEGRRWVVHGAMQYVRVENLPAGAIGPGLLGNGGAYYFQAAGTFSYQFYFRELSAAFTSVGRGVTVEAGRLSFTAKRRGVVCRSHCGTGPGASWTGGSSTTWTARSINGPGTACA